MSDSLLAQAPVSTVLPALDSKRAWGFYHDVLGLETAWLPGMPGDFVASAGRGTTVLVSQRDNAETCRSEAVFVVSDIDATVADLKGRGVDFEMADAPDADGYIGQQGRSRLARFLDTEGNILSVTQM